MKDIDTTDFKITGTFDINATPTAIDMEVSEKKVRKAMKKNEPQAR